MYWDPKMLTKKLTFVYRTIKNDGYYIIPDATDRQLFWLDWYKNYFMDKFKNQNFITSLKTVDLTQSVLINAKTLQLYITPNLRTIIHLADTKNPLKFQINIPSVVVIILAILTYMVVTYLHYKDMIPFSKFI